MLIFFFLFTIHSEFKRERQLITMPWCGKIGVFTLETERAIPLFKVAICVNVLSNARFRVRGRESCVILLSFEDSSYHIFMYSTFNTTPTHGCRCRNVSKCLWLCACCTYIQSNINIYMVNSTHTQTLCFVSFHNWIHLLIENDCDAWKWMTMLSYGANFHGFRPDSFVCCQFNWMTRWCE